MSFCDKSRADRVKTKITFPTLSVCSLALWLAVEPDGATLLTMLAALLHEAGHLLTARLLGVGVSEITLLPLGADIKFSRLTTYREDILTGISGAAANILSALLLLPLGAHPAVRYFICSNLALAAINLLPVDTLDGGTVLRGILSARMPENIVAELEFIQINNGKADFRTGILRNSCDCLCRSAHRATNLPDNGGPVFRSFPQYR